MSRITNAKEARAAIGQRVYWDDVGSRYVFLRSGILNDVYRTKVSIDDYWCTRSMLTNLRTTEAGGHFPEGLKK